MAALAAGMETAVAADNKAAAVEEVDAAVESEPRVLSAMERIELPTGASLGRVFARGWKGRRQRIVVGSAEDVQGSLFTARQLAVRTLG